MDSSVIILLFVIIAILVALSYIVIRSTMHNSSNDERLEELSSSVDAIERKVEASGKSAEAIQQSLDTNFTTQITMFTASMSQNSNTISEQTSRYIRDMSAQLSATQRQASQQTSEKVDLLTRTLSNAQNNSGEQNSRLIKELSSQLNSRVETLTDNLTEQQRTNEAQISDRLQRLSEAVSTTLAANSKQTESAMATLTAALNEAQRTASIQTTERLASLEASVQSNLRAMRDENTLSLEKMRERIEAQLGETLEARLTKSFEAVSSNLAAVQQGLGEMKKLAGDVGSLQRVLTNVKTRGIIGEYQLGAIIKEILTTEQYSENIATVPNSTERVEFAVKLPGSTDETVYMPIDSKYPGDAYEQLLDAYDSGDKKQIDDARKVLVTRLRSFANDIHTKYIAPPYTTEFGIMFLPVEGLYAEALRAGLSEELQSKYRISLAGPTTLAALLNSLQMGFRTLAIQKRSSEVWQVLSDVKKEFGNFESVLTKAQNHLNQTTNDLDALIGTRTRQINRSLARLGTYETADEQLPDIDPRAELSGNSDEFSRE